MNLTDSEVKTLAGDPLILAASERDRILAEWEKRDRVYKAAMKYAFNKTAKTERELLKACARSLKDFP